MSPSLLRLLVAAALAALLAREHAAAQPVYQATGVGVYSDLAWFGETGTPVLHRWSLAEERWLAPVTFTRGQIEAIDLDADAGRLVLVGYVPNGWELSEVDLDALPTAPTHVAWLTGAPCGAASLGSRTAVCLYDEWPHKRVQVLDEAGALVSEAVVDESVGGVVFDRAQRRLYYGSPSTPWDPLRWIDVGAGDELGDVYASDVAGGLPLPSPDGTRIFVPGAVRDASSLAQLGSVGAAGAPVWVGGDLVVARSVYDDGWWTVLAWISPQLAQRGEARVPGTFGAILADGERAVLLTFDEELQAHVRIASLADFDADGVANEDDAFPLDGSESSDRDGDGVGDGRDVFPDDPSETTDWDGDGVGDHGDAFPYDRYEWSDRDGDGWGDNSDALPDDPSEQYDSDGDGVGDNADWLPYDPSEQYDSDGDGVGDNADAFPLDATESYDSDGDGIGDRADPTPFGEPFLRLALNGTQRLKIFGAGYLEGPLQMELGLIEGGLFSACDSGGCLLGAHRPGPDGSFELGFPPAVLEAIDADLEQAMSDALTREIDQFIGVSLTFHTDQARFTIKIGRSGEPKFRMRIPYEVELSGGLPRHHFRGAWVWRVRHPKLLEPPQ